MSVTIITKPTVYLVGKQLLQQAELDRFLADHGVTWESDSEVASEVISESAGRICYMSFVKPRPGGNAAYLHHIKEVGHGSVLEHAVWNFVITGVSRSLTHELVRHRAGWAYSQLSQRYVDESEMEVVVPVELLDEVTLALMWVGSRSSLDVMGVEGLMLNDPTWRTQPMTEAGLVWLLNMLRNGKDYRFLTDYMMKKQGWVIYHEYAKECDRLRACGLTADMGDTHPLPEGEYLRQWYDNNREVKTTHRKAARGTARSVLPNATETKISVTANARALRHFLEQRGSRHAEVEIRRLANAMLDILVKDAPNLFGDYVRVYLPDGTFELKTEFPKV